MLIKDAMGLFIFTLLFSFSSYGFKSFDSCEKYQEIENHLHCGSEGYVIQFGQPYCEAFLQKNEQFSPKGQEILKYIRACLQESLLIELNENRLTCDNIQLIAMKQHTQCYLLSDFCSLPKKDLLKVIWLVKNEFRHPAIIQWALEINKLCTKKKSR